VRNPRRGFTVVEVLVALILASMVLVLIWKFFWGEQRRFAMDQNRLTGLQGAMLLDEYLSWDLERIALFLSEPGRTQFTLNRPVEIVTPGRLDFRMFAEEAGNSLDIPTVAVSYRHEPSTGRVIRSVDGKDRTFLSLLAEDVQFLSRSVAVKPPASGTSYEFTFGQKVEMHYVKYLLTCYSGVARDMPEARRKPQDRVTLVGAVALPFRSDRAYHPYWRTARSELLSNL